MIVKVILVHGVVEEERMATTTIHARAHREGEDNKEGATGDGQNPHSRPDNTTGSSGYREAREKIMGY